MSFFDINSNMFSPNFNNEIISINIKNKRGSYALAPLPE